MPAFNARNNPKEIYGFPAPLFYFGLPAIVLLGISILPVFQIRIVNIPIAIVLIGIGAYQVIHFKEARLLRARRLSKQEANVYSQESIVEF